MSIETRGLITGPSDLLAALPLAAFKVRSWDNFHSLKTQRASSDALRGMRATYESIFDAAHGRRYRCFVYRDAAERRACWMHHTGE